MSKLRWAKFFWADWASDGALRLCPVFARGVWMELLCLAAQSRIYGVVLVGGEIPPERDLARLCACHTKDLRAALKHLEKHHVVRRIGDDGDPLVDHWRTTGAPSGALYSARLVIDWRRFLDHQANGAKGGNPQLKHDNLSDEVNPQPKDGLTLARAPEEEAYPEAEKHPPHSPPASGGAASGDHAFRNGFGASHAADLEQRHDPHPDRPRVVAIPRHAHRG